MRAWRGVTGLCTDVLSQVWFWRVEKLGLQALRLADQETVGHEGRIAPMVLLCDAAWGDFCCLSPCKARV